MKRIIMILLIMSFINSNAQVKRVYQTFFDSGGVKTKGNAIGAKRIGEWKLYYENGQVAEISNYDVLGNLTKMYSSFYEDGKLKSKTVNVNGTYLIKEYYKTGTVKSEKTLEDGYYKEYYDTGELKTEVDIKDGEFNGRWSSLFKDGRSKWSIIYRDGAREGKYRAFYENGDIKLEGYAKGDKKEGEEITYYKGRLVKWKGNYEKGLMTKAWISYDEQGNETKILKYKKGSPTNNEESIFAPIPLTDGIKERYPVFPGCKDAINNRELKICFNEKVNAFITSKFNKVLAAKIKQVGPQEIDINFTVNKYGKSVDIKVKAKFKELIAETTKIIKLLPMSTPGKNEGKPVEINFNTIFKL